MKVTIEDMVIEWNTGEEASVAKLLTYLNVNDKPKPKPVINGTIPKKVKPKVKRPRPGNTTRIARYRERVGNSAPYIKAWALSQGLHVSKSGMIPNEVLDAFESAHLNNA